MGMSDATTAATITAAGQIASQGISAIAQSNLNKKTRKYNLEQYEKERKAALEDWNRQNEYNSPMSQMSRYRDAGLNPNLIYGQSNEGATVRSSNTPAWNPRAPQWDFNAQPTLAAYYDVQLKEAQIDNLKTQNTVQANDAALKAAQTAATVQGTARSSFDLQQAMDLKQISLETASANLRNLNTQNTIALNQDERNAAITSSNITEAYERILKIRLDAAKTIQDTKTSEQETRRIKKSIEDIDKNIELKNLDINLKKSGIQPTDNIFMRIITQLLEGNPSKVKELLRDSTKFKALGNF